MKDKKEDISVFKRAQLIFNFPMVLIHELWHAIFAILLGIGIPKIFFVYNPFVDKEIAGNVDISRDDYDIVRKSKYKFKLYIFLIAPISSIILALIFSFYSIWGIVFLIYNIICLKTSLPSVGDLSHFFYIKEKCIIDCISELESSKKCINSEEICSSVNKITNKKNQFSLLLNISLIKQDIKQEIQIRIEKHNCRNIINESCNCANKGDIV